jgi:hypothetical protein
LRKKKFAERGKTMNEKEYEIKVEVEYEPLTFSRSKPCLAHLKASLPRGEDKELAKELRGTGCWGYSWFSDFIASGDDENVFVSETVEAETWNELEQKVDALVDQLYKTLAANVKANRDLKSAMPAPKKFYLYIK